MKWSKTTIRLRSVWLMVPAFLVLARPTPRLILLGLVPAIAGGLLRAWASGMIHKNRVLATDGPYAHTRNPLYLGSFLTGIGLVTAAGSLVLLVIFMAFYAVVYIPTMRNEERRLERTFGDHFRRYAASVPLFVPRLQPYRSDEPQSTRFALRRYYSQREYEFALGVAAGFLALTARMVLL